jgi:hypothetical protein
VKVSCVDRTFKFAVTLRAPVGSGFAVPREPQSWLWDGVRTRLHLQLGVGFL